MLEALHHALIDTAKILPFLFLTYLVLEYIEHKAAEKTARLAAIMNSYIPKMKASKSQSPKYPAAEALFLRFLLPLIVNAAFS